MKQLIAKRRILYLGQMYEAGDTLPANDADMARAWLRAGSAAWNGPEMPQGSENRQGGQEYAEGENANQNGQEAPKNGHEGALVLDTVRLVDGHLDPEQLAAMKKDALEKLAAQLGVDISKAKNNTERAALIAAVTVQAPANENGGAQ